MFKRGRDSDWVGNWLVTVHRLGQGEKIILCW